MHLASTSASPTYRRCGAGFRGGEVLRQHPPAPTLSSFPVWSDKVQKAGIDLRLLRPTTVPSGASRMTSPISCNRISSGRPRSPCKSRRCLRHHVGQHPISWRRAVSKVSRARRGGSQAHVAEGFTRSDVATEILDAGAVIVGSPTINNNMFPAMADVQSYPRDSNRKTRSARLSAPMAGAANRSNSSMPF
jgi:hypothetical protein